MGRAERAGKVFIDWSQNNTNKTTVAPWSLRGRLRPTVAAARRLALASASDWALASAWSPCCAVDWPCPPFWAMASGTATTAAAMATMVSNFFMGGLLAMAGDGVAGGRLSPPEPFYRALVGRPLNVRRAKKPSRPQTSPSLCAF